MEGRSAHGEARSEAAGPSRATRRQRGCGLPTGRLRTAARRRRGVPNGAAPVCRCGALVAHEQGQRWRGCAFHVAARECRGGVPNGRFASLYPLFVYEQGLQRSGADPSRGPRGRRPGVPETAEGVAIAVRPTGAAARHPDRSVFVHERGAARSAGGGQLVKTRGFRALAGRALSSGAARRSRWSAACRRRRDAPPARAPRRRCRSRGRRCGSRASNARAGGAGAR
jgi:hypothetical protein